MTVDWCIGWCLSSFCIYVGRIVSGAMPMYMFYLVLRFKLCFVKWINRAHSKLWTNFGNLWRAGAGESNRVHGDKREKRHMKIVNKIYFCYCLERITVWCYEHCNGKVTKWWIVGYFYLSFKEKLYLFCALLLWRHKINK